jgi:hypothetical protein
MCVGATAAAWGAADASAARPFLPAVQLHRPGPEAALRSDSDAKFRRRRLQDFSAACKPLIPLEKTRVGLPVPSKK